MLPHYSSLRSGTCTLSITDVTIAAGIYENRYAELQFTYSTAVRKLVQRITTISKCRSILTFSQMSLLAATFPCLRLRSKQELASVPRRPIRRPKLRAFARDAVSRRAASMLDARTVRSEQRQLTLRVSRAFKRRAGNRVKRRCAPGPPPARSGRRSLKRRWSSAQHHVGFGPRADIGRARRSRSAFGRQSGL